MRFCSLPLVVEELVNFLKVSALFNQRIDVHVLLGAVGESVDFTVSVLVVIEVLSLFDACPV